MEGPEDFLEVLQHTDVVVVDIVWVLTLLAVLESAVIVGHQVQMHHIEADQCQSQTRAANEYTHNLAT